jgi:hypothetical protein
MLHTPFDIFIFMVGNSVENQEESIENLLDVSKNQKDSLLQTKCSALIPNEILEKLKEAGYENRAEAIRLGLECLLQESQKNQKESQKNQEESIEKLKESNGNLRESVSTLKAQNSELEKHNITLKEELDKAHQDKDELRNLYDNYMRQMQTLIQQKAIKAPGEKKIWWKFW